MRIKFAEWTRTLKIFVSHVKAPESVSTAEKALNNLLDKITHSVSVSLFFQPPKRSLTEPVNKVAETEASHKLCKIDFLLPMLTWVIRLSAWQEQTSTLSF